MHTTYPMYADTARLEISQRHRQADDERRRRLARRTSDALRPWLSARARQLLWR